MVPDAWQAAILRRRAKREILNCARQLGKSQVVAAAAVDEILRGPARVLTICPAERQSKLLVEKVRAIYEQLVGRLREPQSTTHLTFANGAEMWALPSSEANIRGFSAVSLLIVDEASRVPDTLFHSVRPMLAVSNGRILCLSTPFGKRGFFHKEWTEGVNWHRTLVRADQCARISPEFLEEERKSLPDAWFRQEYMCEFSETDGAVFSYDDVMRSLSDKVFPLFDVPELSGEVEPLFQ